MQNYVSTYGPNPMIQFWHLCKEMEEATVGWTRATRLFEARDEIRCRKRGIQSNPIQDYMSKIEGTSFDDQRKAAQLSR
jgi:hypothetical protein